MTREEIREGIKKTIEAEARNGYLWDFREFVNTVEEGVVEDYLYKLADLIVEKESSQGVVIKVDNTRYITAHKSGDAFIETVAVESLVKE